MQNIGVAFVKIAQFSDAVTSFEHIMGEKASFQTGMSHRKALLLLTQVHNNNSPLLSSPLPLFAPLNSAPLLSLSCLLSSPLLFFFLKICPIDCFFLGGGEGGNLKFQTSLIFFFDHRWIVIII